MACVLLPQPLSSKSSYYFVVHVFALILAYCTIADSGAGLVAAIAQLLCYEVVDARRSILYTLRLIFVKILCVDYC